MTPNSNQNYAAFVVGGGAVGTALSWQLALRGAQVSVYGRSGQRTQSVPFIEYGGTKISIKLSELTPSKPDFAAIAVKAYDLEWALKYWMPRLGGVPCVVFSNGYWEDVVRPFEVQSGSILRWGTCTLGVRSNESGAYEQTSEVGSFTFGPPDLSNGADSLPSPCEQGLTNVAVGGVKLQWVPAMRWIVRKKWLFNTVINTLCARNQLRSNGELLQMRPEVEGFFEEAWELGECLYGTQWPFSSRETLEELLSLVSATAQNENSMARDVRLGRQTEIDFLAGLSKHYGSKFPKLKGATEKIES